MNKTSEAETEAGNPIKEIRLRNALSLFIDI